MPSALPRLHGVLSSPEVQAALSRAREKPGAPESKRLLVLEEIARTLLGEDGAPGHGREVEG